MDVRLGTKSAIATRRRQPATQIYDSPSAVPHPARVPDGEYLALCTHVHHDRQSRNYGERVYLDFQLWDCQDEGKIIRMYLRPSVYPTSNFYRSWAIARGGPPRSRNTKMSARVFVGKLFRVLTTTVKPRHRIAGEDGKSRPGPFLPEAFWYSKVLCILALEATNEKIGPVTTVNATEEESDATLHSPVNVTNSSSNPFSESDLSEGEVGRRELGDGSKRGSTDFAVRDEHHHNAPPLAGEGEAISSPASSPRDCVTPQSREYHGDVKRQKEILRARGFLP
jgi:hypothetical protein